MTDEETNPEGLRNLPKATPLGASGSSGANQLSLKLKLARLGERKIPNNYNILSCSQGAKAPVEEIRQTLREELWVL